MVDMKEVAKAKGLNANQTKVLQALADKRFKGEGHSYLDQWASRIAKGEAFARGDAKTKKVLKKYGLKEYVVVGSSNGKVYDNWGTFSDLVDASDMQKRLLQSPRASELEFDVFEAGEYLDKRMKARKVISDSNMRQCVPNYKKIWDKPISVKKSVPSQQEIVNEMELHNADEVGINNQWDYEEAEYHLLLSDKYYKPKKYKPIKVKKSKTGTRKHKRRKATKKRVAFKNKEGKTISFLARR